MVHICIYAVGASSVESETKDKNKRKQPSSGVIHSIIPPTVAAIKSRLGETHGDQD